MKNHPAQLNQHALFAEPAQPPDDTAVDNFATRMKAKLAHKREEGRSGWQGMNADELTIILRQHVDKGDPIDVANLCMMLSENGQCIAPAEPAQGEQLPQDVINLVIAARDVVYGGHIDTGFDILDKAVEAFASRVPWGNEPDEEPAAPTTEAEA